MANINIDVPIDFKERVIKECQIRGVDESILIQMAVEYLLNKQEFERSGSNVLAE